MKLIRFCIFSLLIGIFLTGCKTAQVVQQDESKTKPVSKPSHELRGLYVSFKSGNDKNVKEIKDAIDEITVKGVKANYNAIYFASLEQNFSFYSLCLNSGSIDPEFDIIDYALETAHRNGLKFYLVIDLFKTGSNSNQYENIRDQFYKASKYVPTDSTWLIIAQDGNPVKDQGSGYLNPAFPQVKTYLKQGIRCIVESYNIDGLTFDQRHDQVDIISYDKYSIKEFESDSLRKPVTRKQWTSNRITDLVEDVVVEAMLMKPYLINSAIFQVADGALPLYTWLENGIVDLLIPDIQVMGSNPDQKLKDFWYDLENKEKMSEYIYPLVSTDGNVPAELVNVNFKYGGQGMIWMLNNSIPNGNDPIKVPFYYEEKIDMPDSLKLVTPKQVIGLDLSSLDDENHSGQPVYFTQGNKIKLTDSEGLIGFISTDPDTVEFEFNSKTISLSKQRWVIPYRYTVQPDNRVKRKFPWVEFRRMPAIYTQNPDYHLLCKTEADASAWIGNDPLKVYKTGIFFNKITLDEGPNRVRATVMSQDSSTTFYECEFNYEEHDDTRNPYPLWIDEQSVLPDMDLQLMPEDIVQVSFQGSLQQFANVKIKPDGLSFNCSREDFDDYSVYKADVPLRKLSTGISYKIILELTSGDSLNNPDHKYILPNTIMVKGLTEFPLVKVTEEHARLTYNLGPVRLGGPIRSEFEPGIIMKTNGKLGENYRIRLNRVEDAMINQSNVEELPAVTTQPSYFITNMSCAPTSGADILSIPYLEPIPYAIYPDPDQNRIVITLFGAMTSSTWISHRKGRKVIDKVTWQQTTPKTYEIYVNLKSPKIWGYDIRPERKRLVLNVKYPPSYNLENNKPLSGLNIAIEAGHGGSSTGAVGLSGLLEKDINLDLSFKLGEICKTMGADVVQVRESDRNMSLAEKRNVAINSFSDILISIHANAAGTSRGYLRVPGTSTYYNNPFWAPFAETVYDRLLETGLEEFGVVGSFNYTVIRVSQMPSILVEQAFMTHAEDEEKLADEEFRQQMAEKIYEGMMDYLEYMQE